MLSDQQKVNPRCANGPRSMTDASIRIGAILTFLAILFGLGALLLTKKDVYVVAKNQGII